MDQDRLARYKSREGAESYNVKYASRLTKRWNTARERKVVGKALAIAGAHARMLDVPCGTGRLFPSLAPHAAEVVETDVSLEMLKLGRANLAGAPARFVNASALDLPFRSGAIPCVFSARLSHHLPDRRQRERYVREMGRVAARYVVFSYFDHASIKNWLRRIRKPFNRKRDRYTISRQELRDMAAAAGLRVVTTIPLSRLFSGHRYAVLEKLE